MVSRIHKDSEKNEAVAIKKLFRKLFRPTVVQKLPIILSRIVEVG